LWTLPQTQPPIWKRGKIVKKNFLENFGKNGVLLLWGMWDNLYMENEMNIIRFKEKGFTFV